MTNTTEKLQADILAAAGEMISDLLSPTDATTRHVESLPHTHPKWLICVETEVFTGYEVTIEPIGWFGTFEHAIAHSKAKLNKKVVSEEDHKAIVRKLANVTSRNQEALAKLRSLIEIAKVLETNRSLSHPEKNGVIAIIAQMTKDAIDCLKVYASDDDNDLIPF